MGRSFVLGALLLAAFAGCRNDCRSYCEKWQECINASLHVGRCVDACNDFRAQSEERADRVEDCGICIERNPKCSEVSGACFSQCLAIPRGD